MRRSNLLLRLINNLNHVILFGILIVNSMINCKNVYGLTFIIRDNSDIIGMVQTITVRNNEELFDIARKFDIGITELMEANPKINPKKLIEGSMLLIPTEFILPNVPREGIVINLAELRLYFFPKNSNLVVTHPVGIGRIGWRTPIVEAKILKKKKNPTWTPPASIRNSAKRKGKILKAVYPPGPNNPLGEYALRLDLGNYLIHGTNKPESVGLRSSSGCIRMYPEDIKSLFYQVEAGVNVKIVYEPFKIGKNGNELYLEAHEPFPDKYYELDEDDDDIVRETIDKMYSRYRRGVDWPYTMHSLEQTVGYPVKIYRN